MKKLIVSVFVLLCVSSATAQKFSDFGKENTSSATFYSKSPLEDIEATNKNVAVILDVATGDIQVIVTMKLFKFKNALMEEHFNENYVESSKFPICKFKGKVDDKIDLTKEGEQKVSVTGKMELHGVTKDVTINGVVAKSGDNLTLNAKFPLKVADYDIKVPSLYVKNIAEVVDVSLVSLVKPYVKK